MKSLIKDYMSKNKVLVSYVRDAYGFRKGVVVALGPTTLGYSLVNKSADVEYRDVKPWQLPAVQRMAAAKVEVDGKMVPAFSASDVLASKAYRRASEELVVRIPLFDRKIGIMRAIDSALNEEIKVVDGKIVTAQKVVGYNLETKTQVTESNIPKDKDFLDVIKVVAERASRAKW